MTEPAAPAPAPAPAAKRVWTPGLRRLYYVYAVISALALGLVFTLGMTFRVADCGPADPQLLRYLGTPILHSTGVGVPSSLESRIWAAPLLANVVFLGTLIFVLNALNQRRPSRRDRVPRKGVLRVGLGLSVVLLVALSSMMIAANDVQWTWAGPPIDAATCDIGFAWFPDTQAWQPAEDAP